MALKFKVAYEIIILIDFENINRKFEAYEEMKDMFELIKSSLKLHSTATFSETLKAVKKVVSKKALKNDK